MSDNESTATVMAFLTQARARTQSAEERELLSTALEALLFITSTGQRYAFEDFRRDLAAHMLPPVVASFQTRSEADAWLSHLPEPPDSTFVLIAGEYHIVFYRRESNLRRIVPDPVLEHHLDRLVRSGLPAAIASFDTREAAEAWLVSQPEPPRQAVILIGGEPHLAVHHQGVNHRAIYAFPSETRS